MLDSHRCPYTGSYGEEILIALLLISLCRMVRYTLVGTALVGVKYAIGNAAAMVVDAGVVIG